MITEFTNAYRVMKAQITDNLADDDLAMAIEIYSKKIDTLLELMMELSGKELETILDIRDCFVRLQEDLEHKHKMYCVEKQRVKELDEALKNR